MRPRWRRWFRLIAILLVLAWTQHDQVVRLPQPAGPYAVGRVEYDWIDASRLEAFTPDPDDHRELSVWIWFPAAPAAAGQALPYLPEPWRAAEERVHGGLLGQFLYQDLAHVQAHAEAGLPVAPSDQPYPVVIFQPGLGPSHPDYTALLEDLASRGYVVVASTPTYSANANAFPDGRIVERVDAATLPDSASPARSKAILNKLIEVWAADNLFVVHQVDRLNAGNSGGRFTGKLDVQATGIMGHSFGGASAAEACRIDPRCKAGVDLDGSPFGKVVATGLSQPLLFFWSEPGPAQQDAQAQALQDVETLVDHSPGPVSS